MSKDEEFKTFLEDLGELLKKKNTAYGSSFLDTYRKFGYVSAIVRISDKMNRLKNINDHKYIDTYGESLIDTLTDLAGYCILTLAAETAANVSSYYGDNNTVFLSYISSTIDSFEPPKSDLYLKALEEKYNCLVDLEHKTNHINTTDNLKDMVYLCYEIIQLRKEKNE